MNLTQFSIGGTPGFDEIVRHRFNKTGWNRGSGLLLYVSNNIPSTCLLFFLSIQFKFFSSYHSTFLSLFPSKLILFLLPRQGFLLYSIFKNPLLHLILYEPFDHKVPSSYEDRVPILILFGKPWILAISYKFIFFRFDIGGCSSSLG